MATVLAVDIYDKQAKLMALQAEPGARVVVLRTEVVDLPQMGPEPEPLAPDSAAEAGGTEEGADGNPELDDGLLANGTDGANGTNGANGANGNGAANQTLSGLQPSALSIFSDLDIDMTLAVSGSSKILYSQLLFPFRDQKKIEQVAPLQVQDSLPFEIDEFVLDAVVLGESKSGEYHVLGSLTPRVEVASTLSSLQAVGIDPKYLTTRASALGSLAMFCNPGLEGLQAYILVSPEQLSFAAVLNGTIVSLRELSRTMTDLESAVKAVACSLLSLEKSHSVETSAIYVVGTASDISYFRRMLFRPVVALDLSAVVEIAPGVEASDDAIAAALGAAAPELMPRKRGEPRKFVDFRQGPFAYRRTWLALWAALKQEAVYVTFVIFWAFMWFGGRMYLSSYALQQVNHRIQESVHAALPNEVIPLNGEISSIQSKLDSLEDELRGMGSLSSLSPLESLKELAQAIPGIDVVIDNVSIGYSKMTIRGSVPDNASNGKLSAALSARKDRFCSVSVDPKGKTSDNRVGFTAEIGFCE